MLWEPVNLVISLVAIHAVALVIVLCSSVRSRRSGRPERPSTPLAVETSAAEGSGPATADPLRDLVDHVERLETAERLRPRGEAKLAADLGRWRRYGTG